VDDRHLQRAFSGLSLAKMLSGANTFEIATFKKMKLRPRWSGDQDVTMLH
jgi:hypothetical protein